MRWLDDPDDLDGAVAATVARAMRVVAQADGMVHPRELSLIAQFESELPEGVEPQSTLSAGDVQVLLRSVVMVALADGRISEAEEQAIAAIATEQGVGADDLEALVDRVKRDFLEYFAGRATFRASVLEVAQELGLRPPELAALRGEA